MPASIGVNLRVTGHCRQGGRKYMEDFFSVAYQHTEDECDLEYAFFGIYDGHGGAEAAAFAKEHLMETIIKHKSFWSENDDDVLRAIKDGYIATHYAMWKEQEKWPKTASGLPSTAGTTASVAFIRHGKIYIGHVGDSGIILGYQDDDSLDWKARQLTRDHKPENLDEMTRINRCGGKVVSKSGVPRVVWNRPKVGHQGPVRRSTPIDEIPFLAVARSLGDLWSYNSQINQFVVSPDPDCQVIKIDILKYRCLIFGTDGLFNMLSAHNAVSIVQQTERHNIKATLKLNGYNNQWLNPSKLLVEKALERWYNTKMRADNTSVITIMLDPPGPPRAQVIKNLRKNQKVTYPDSGLRIMTRFQENPEITNENNDNKNEVCCSLSETVTPTTTTTTTNTTNSSTTNPTIEGGAILATSNATIPTPTMTTTATTTTSSLQLVSLNELFPLKEHNYLAKLPTNDCISNNNGTVCENNFDKENLNNDNINKKINNDNDDNDVIIDSSIQINEISSSSNDLLLLLDDNENQSTTVVNETSNNNNSENDEKVVTRHYLRSSTNNKNNNNNNNSIVERLTRQAKRKLYNNTVGIRKSSRIDLKRAKLIETNNNNSTGLVTSSSLASTSSNKSINKKTVLLKEKITLKRNNKKNNLLNNNNISNKQTTTTTKLAKKKLLNIFKRKSKRILKKKSAVISNVNNNNNNIKVQSINNNNNGKKIINNKRERLKDEFYQMSLRNSSKQNLSSITTLSTTSSTRINNNTKTTLSYNVQRRTLRRKST